VGHAWGIFLTQMADIAFLDSTHYNGNTVRQAAAGGIQHGTTSLAEAFARLGHAVTVFNRTSAEVKINAVKWRRLPSDGAIQADLVIVNNAVHLLDRAGMSKKVVWFRNPVKLHRLFKKGDLLPVYRHRPHAVFLGSYHAGSVSRFLPFSSRHIIPHAPPGDFARSRPVTKAPPPRALFVSQPYRGLAWLLDIWASSIFPKVPGAELHVFTADWDQVRVEDYQRFGVVKRRRVPRTELAVEMMNSRVMLYPGHRNETFCFAAAEASAAGLPVITRGIGSLIERVRHGENGYVSFEAADFAAHSTALLLDDDLWLDMHGKTLAGREAASWEDRAGEWARTFLG
jgi:glycosyltransferase involved in cell wall biosynthesis